jgi:hypothetical protein
VKRETAVVKQGSHRGRGGSRGNTKAKRKKEGNEIKEEVLSFSNFLIYHSLNHKNYRCWKALYYP